MCGGFTPTWQTRPPRTPHLGVSVDHLFPDSYTPRWSIAPSDPLGIVRMKREDREALPARWGLVQFGSKDAKRGASQINPRAGTLAGRPAFPHPGEQDR